MSERYFSTPDYVKQAWDAMHERHTEETMRKWEAACQRAANARAEWIRAHPGQDPPPRWFAGGWSDLPFQVRGGFIVSGLIGPEENARVVDELNRQWAAESERISEESYLRGVEDGKALYQPRTRLGRFFG